MSIVLKPKSIKLSTKQLDDKVLQAFNEFNAAGKIVYLLI